MSQSSPQLTQLQFEVHGRVQGVFFRAHTVSHAQKLGLVGWCANTARRTVVGEVQGPEDKVEEMKYWLGHVGSPASSITRLDVAKVGPIEALGFGEMSRRPNVP
ncbi:hypothetical protein Rsub_10071 [Raphidocelis subcapitata]|uniref:acylphosphatase n=1 Tax=Raphidocelis subcapitata TaxID=307507 RepID=A0A2V0PH12_9CHLO|nr:hypothetical protein Rsub_10071 [Raphidocelis subcapitata]|eukprot:GBF97210.1 hypothetical protein Rsub_10071 [Raphidocelis subcapitata]